MIGVNLLVTMAIEQFLDTLPPVESSTLRITSRVTDKDGCGWCGAEGFRLTPIINDNGLVKLCDGCRDAYRNGVS